ncbi:MAG TPA: MoaD/ThiS family protein [Actinomycetota bacterium]|nr:MoaD/ThiS family protein [Actinomycetota bacterium]
MSVTVRIPTQLRTLTDGSGEVAAAGATLGEVIDDLESRFPGIGERILNAGELRRFVNLYVDGEDVRFLGGLQTPVAAGAAVAIIPAVAGG